MSAIEHEISDDEYEEFLNEIYGEVTICGMTFDSGRALKELDPVAFDCGKSDMMQWECSECGKVYEEESDADECWKDCAETTDCEECGEPILNSSYEYQTWSTTIRNNGNIVGHKHYCSEVCWKLHDDEEENEE